MLWKKIIGCSCVVSFNPLKGLTALRNQVADYCGWEVDWHLPSNVLEDVVSWPMKVFLHTQHTCTHSFTGLSAHKISQLKSFCANISVWIELLCWWFVFLGQSSLLLWSLWSQISCMCASVHVRVCIWPTDKEQTSIPRPWAPLQHHPWALFWSPRQSFSSATS